MAAARERLGVAAFEASWAEGQALSEEAAIQLALGSAQDVRVGSSQPASIVSHLSAREREVTVLIAHGLSSAEIAERLVITPRTADTHADNIRSKLGLRSRPRSQAGRRRRG